MLVFPFGEGVGALRALEAGSSAAGAMARAASGSGVVWAGALTSGTGTAGRGAAFFLERASRRIPERPRRFADFFLT